MLNRIKNGNVRFVYSIYAVVPEIPIVIDVLFALRLSDEQKYYWFASANHETYISNVHLAAAAVGTSIYLMRPQVDKDKARKMIARAIVDLCPPKAACLFNHAYTKALDELDKNPIQKKWTRNDRIAACSCSQCGQRRIEESIPEATLA